MSERNILATLQKHINESVNGENLGVGESNKSMSKSQIHRFSENMKGVNEFIGAAQSIVANLTKIKNLAQKIESIDEMMESQSYKSTQQTLEINRQNYVGDLEHLANNASFLGISLFDMELSCVVNGKIFELIVENPMSFLDNNLCGYCTQKQDEVNMLLGEISTRLSTPSQDEADYSNFNAQRFGELFGRY